jgi:hypothetical protein
VKNYIQKSVFLKFTNITRNSIPIKRPIPCQEHCWSFGDLKSGGQVIRNVKYAGDFVLLAKEETVLQGMFCKLTEIGRFCGKEMHVNRVR